MHPFGYLLYIHQDLFLPPLLFKGLVAFVSCTSVLDWGCCFATLAQGKTFPLILCSAAAAPMGLQFHIQAAVDPSPVCSNMGLGSGTNAWPPTHSPACRPPPQDTFLPPKSTSCPVSRGYCFTNSVVTQLATLQKMQDHQRLAGASIVRAWR